MQPEALHSIAVREGANAEKFPPLELVTRPYVATEQAAHYLNRRPNTLRVWAMDGRVIQPLRLNGRLCWPVEKIRAVLGVSQ
jgi:hypothetical protein